MLKMAAGEGRTSRTGFAADMRYDGFIARDGLIRRDEDWTTLYRDDPVHWVAR
jgi:hypothetical protein